MGPVSIKILTNFSSKRRRGGDGAVMDLLENMSIKSLSPSNDVIQLESVFQIVTFFSFNNYDKELIKYSESISLSFIFIFI